MDVGRNLNDLATAELARSHYDEAELSCLRAIIILESSSPRNYQDLIDALDNYSWLLEKTKRHAQAELVQTRIMVYRAKFQESQRVIRITSFYCALSSRVLPVSPS